MPNCDWYGALNDHRGLLDFLFAEGTCDVYELASSFEKPLIQFHSTEEVLAQLDRRHPNGTQWWAVHLKLYVKGAGPPFSPRRIELNPAACGGARFRFAAEGWGLVQLYLETLNGEKGLRNSHSNHCSQRRAERGYLESSGQSAPSLWDFKRITAFSSRLNRRIRKASVGRLGKRAVLPGALEAWEQGNALGPYTPQKHTIEL